jgi:hypothetical protein
MMNAQLAHALPYGLNIPRQAIGKTEDTRCYQRFGALIPQLALPFPVRVGLFDIEREAYVV